MDKLETVIWDVDGTIVNSFPAHHEWFEGFFQRRFGKLFPFTPDQLREAGKDMPHPEFYNLLANMAGDTTFSWEREGKQLEKEYASHMDSAEHRLVHGITVALYRLESRGINQGIATNRDMPTSQRDLVRLLGNTDYFKAIVCPNERLRKKPNPDVIIEAMHLLKCSRPENAIYVGDMPIDVQAGKEAGAITVALYFDGVSYSTRKELEDAKPDHIIKRPEDLLNIALRN